MIEALTPIPSALDVTRTSGVPLTVWWLVEIKLADAVIGIAFSVVIRVVPSQPAVTEPKF
jgi:hypothetical protein